MIARAGGRPTTELPTASPTVAPGPQLACPLLLQLHCPLLLQLFTLRIPQHMLPLQDQPVAQLGNLLASQRIVHLVLYS